VKLAYLDTWTGKRQENARDYIDKFKEKGLDKIIHLPIQLVHYRHIFNQFVIRAPKRDDLMKHLRDCHIGCEVYYPVALHNQECFAYLKYKKGSFPVAEQAAAETLAIPIYPELTSAQKQYIVDKIYEFYSK
jgi:dTDP-4-amino-4,6-dideoxygalactose transaminase